MKWVLTYIVCALTTLSCAAQHKTNAVRIPIIKYNPETYLSDIERALTKPTSFECQSTDSQQFSGIDEDILAYISEQDAFIVSLTDGDTEFSPKLIGIKDKEKGYLKYLNVEEERISYSLDIVITHLYGSVEDYIATWPEAQRHLFYDDPQGLYTFPNSSFATDVAGWGNSKKPSNPVKFNAAISYLRTTRSEWNDDTWANDSTEIVKHSDSVTGILIHYADEKPRFEGQDDNYFSKWVQERLNYPDAALENAATGRVTLKFEIDMFGNLEDVKVLRSPHPALDSIAFNVVSSSPKWIPAKDRMGNPQATVYTLPVIFTPEMMFEAFITKMYNEKLYEDYDFLMKHCSPELLKKLQDAYPYDSDEPAYATWLFRSSQQDNETESDTKSAILYNALDMSWEYSNRIKLISSDGKIIIEDINNLK